MGSCKMSQLYACLCSPSQSKKHTELEKKKMRREEENIYQVSHECVTSSLSLTRHICEILVQVTLLEAQKACRYCWTCDPVLLINFPWICSIDFYVPPSFLCLLSNHQGLNLDDCCSAYDQIERSQGHGPYQDVCNIKEEEEEIQLEKPWREGQRWEEKSAQCILKGFSLNVWYLNIRFILYCTGFEILYKGCRKHNV